MVPLLPCLVLPLQWISDVFNRFLGLHSFVLFPLWPLNYFFFLLVSGVQPATMVPLLPWLVYGPPFMWISDTLYRFLGFHSHIFLSLCPLTIFFLVFGSQRGVAVPAFLCLLGACESGGKRCKQTNRVEHLTLRTFRATIGIMIIRFIIINI